MQCELGYNKLAVLAQVVTEYDWERRPVPEIPIHLDRIVIEGYVDKLMERKHVPEMLDKILNVIAETVAPNMYRDFYVRTSGTRAIVWHVPRQQYVANMRYLRKWLQSKM
jgi:hypothetical protein